MWFTIGGLCPPADEGDRQFLFIKENIIGGSISATHQDYSRGLKRGILLKRSSHPNSQEFLLATSFWMVHVSLPYSLYDRLSQIILVWLESQYCSRLDTLFDQDALYHPHNVEYEVKNLETNLNDYIFLVKCGHEYMTHIPTISSFFFL